VPLRNCSLTHSGSQFSNKLSYLLPAPQSSHRRLFRVNTLKKSCLKLGLNCVLLISLSFSLGGRSFQTVGAAVNCEVHVHRRTIMSLWSADRRQNDVRFLTRLCKVRRKTSVFLFLCEKHLYSTNQHDGGSIKR